MERRYGKVKISVDLIEKNPEMISNIVFKDCVVLRAECFYIDNVIEYLIYYPEFDEIGIGYKTLEYNVVITKNEDDSGVIAYSREFKEVCYD